MKKSCIDEALVIIEKNFNSPEIRKGYGISANKINEIIHLLNVCLPKSYQEFLNKVGFINIGYLFIPGVSDENTELKNSSLVLSILNDRADPEYPPFLINLHDIGNGDTYCLDTSQMDEHGECPVVVWPIGGYEQTPVLEVVAKDFGEFFLNMVKQQIEYKNQTQS